MSLSLTHHTAPDHEGWPSRTVFWICLAAFTLVWFGTLDYRHLIRTDEGRYAEIAREMFATGDWLTPRYNDYKYFEKPPLQAWMTAIAYTLFGVGEWQSRLWTGLTGYLGILAVGFTGTKIFSRRAGLLAAIVLAGSPMWSIGGHFNTLDMGLSSIICMALCALLLAQRPSISKQEERAWMWACWALMALAVLSKGLIGIVIPGMVLVAYTVIARDWKLWKRLHLISGLLWFFAIATPWHVLVSLKNPEFAHFYFIHEHFERFTTTAHNRTGSYFYFVPLIVAGFLPWLAQLPSSLKSAWQAEEQANGFRPDLMLLIWAVLIFLFFSKSNSKLPGYIIPVFPALALLAGHWLATHPLSLKRWRWQIGIFIAICTAGFGSLPFVAKLGREPFQHAEYANYVWWIAVALTVGITGLIAAWRLAAQYRMASIATFAASLFAVCMIAGLGHETLGRSVSGVDLAAAAKPKMQAGVPFYAVHGLDHTVPFYLQTPSIMVEYPDELEFGIKQEPEKWAPTLNDFMVKWHELPQAYALMSLKTHKTLQEKGLPMHEIARDERRVIVQKPITASPASAKP